MGVGRQDQEVQESAGQRTRRKRDEPIFSARFRMGRAADGVFYMGWAVYFATRIFSPRSASFPNGSQKKKNKVPEMVVSICHI